MFRLPNDKVADNGASNVTVERLPKKRTPPGGR
jgi:hypothetical protein